MSQKPPSDPWSTQPAAPNTTRAETQSSVPMTLDAQVGTQESPLAISTLRGSSQEPSHNIGILKVSGLEPPTFQDKWSHQSLLPIGWRLLHEARKISRQLSLVLTLAGMMIISLISLGQPWMHFQVPLMPPGDPDGSLTIPIDTIFFVQCPDVVCMYEYDQNACKACPVLTTLGFISPLLSQGPLLLSWNGFSLPWDGVSSSGGTTHHHPILVVSPGVLLPAFPPAVAMAERVLAPTQMGRGDRYYTYTELLAISRRFKQNPNELMITWILRVYDQGGPALSLNSGELALLGDLTHDAIFNYHCKTLRGGCQTLLTWLLQAWRRRWESFLHFEATELPFRPWTTMEEGIQLVRELGMLDWIYREPSSPPSPPAPEYAAPEDVPFTQGLQRRLLTAAPSELRLSLVSLLVKGMTVLEAVMEIQTIADVGLLWRQSQPGRAKLMLGPNPTRKDLTGWLLSHGVPRERVDKQPTKVLLELYIKEAKRSRSQPLYGLGEEQPPPPPYSDQACGEEPPMRHD
ncbi:Friend virus susceptibility protein 1 [Sciurus carolinensis]|uniref:Friend virus susceptibility protein 1 n=2 Tax=Sciurus carolinensis TaxID=30640 RepID=A0AA41NBA8_SCICA|nr:Friend virus susceptibility protein 1 [Sciurus carolinensis]